MTPDSDSKELAEVYFYDILLFLYFKVVLKHFDVYFFI